MQTAAANGAADLRAPVEAVSFSANRSYKTDQKKPPNSLSHDWKMSQVAKLLVSS